MSKAIIIGAGIAGIASAIRLTLKGYDVDVFEASSSPGGKLSEIRIGDFRFDAGPSLFTMPQYVDELFILAGKDPQDHFKYHRLENTCKYFYEDGARINAFSDSDKFAEEIGNKTIDPPASVTKFLKKSEQIYNITHEVFLERSLHKIGNYLNLNTLRSLIHFPQIDPFRSMSEANQSSFNDPKTIQLFNRYATYNGSNPYQAPATLNVIPHFEHNFGAWFPDGGMYSIVSSLVELACSLGVEFHYNTYVDEIVLSNNKVKGVKIKGQHHFADLVISNMDIWYTYNKLLKGLPIPKRIQSQERSSSALIFYWGINKSFPEIDLHNIFFSKNYEEEFRAIWQSKNIYHDPSVYVNVSSKFNRGDAPEGSENWFTMINVPSDTGQDWDALIKDARTNILKKVSRILGEDIAELISCEAIMDPRDIDSKTFSYQGSLYGSSSNSRFSAFLRHANFSSKVKDLYFVGGSVHPGGGIPLALLSAKIVEGLIN